MSFRILQVGDSHHSDNAPVRRVSYRDDILNKEREISAIAKEYKVDAIIRMGDIFHIKQPSKTSHYLVSTLISIWKELPCKNYSIIGNHDIRFDRMQSLDEQPFMSLVESGAVDLIPENKELQLFGSDKLNVYISGIYGYGEADGRDKNRYKVERNSLETVHIKATHTFLLPDKTKFPGVSEVTNLNEVADYGADIYLSGHVHDYYGISRNKDTYLSMPGSISRGSLDELDKNRTVKVVLVEINSRGNYRFEEIPLKSAKPAKDVFKASFFNEKYEDTSIQVGKSAVDQFVDYFSLTANKSMEFSLKDEILKSMNNRELSKDAGQYILEQV